MLKHILLFSAVAALVAVAMMLYQNSSHPMHVATPPQHTNGEGRADFAMLEVVAEYPSDQTIAVLLEQQNLLSVSDLIMQLRTAPKSALLADIGQRFEALPVAEQLQVIQLLKSVASAESFHVLLAISKGASAEVRQQIASALTGLVQIRWRKDIDQELQAGIAQALQDEQLSPVILTALRAARQSLTGSGEKVRELKQVVVGSY